MKKHAVPLPHAARWSLILGVAGFAILTCCGARLAVPIPGTPVPATLQTLPVLMAGLFLGARAGSISQGLYLTLGLAGLPVFALPGAGPAYLLGPTGGYLLGFVAAPWVVGRVAPRGGEGSWPRRLAALLLGTATIHACGLAWLSAYAAGGAGGAFRLGLLPFALFDLAKIVAALALHALWLDATKRIGSRWRSGSAL